MIRYVSCKNVRYLFNGDIADRGRYAVEIFLILFAFKLAEPSSVIINRGNHESANMNEIYGFADEGVVFQKVVRLNVCHKTTFFCLLRIVRQKYGPIIYEKFQDIFNILPLCIVVERRVLVVHGGLFREDGVTLEAINNINRRRQCPSAPVTKEVSKLDRGAHESEWNRKCVCFA